MRRSRPSASTSTRLLSPRHGSRARSSPFKRRSRSPSPRWMMLAQPAMSEALTILVVDDEPAWVGALGAVLGKAGHHIVAAYDGEEALRRFRAEPVDAVL